MAADNNKKKLKIPDNESETLSVRECWTKNNSACDGVNTIKESINELASFMAYLKNSNYEAARQIDTSSAVAASPEPADSS